MIEQYLRKSNIVEVVSVDHDEGTGAFKIVLRAQHEKQWIRLMSDALRATQGYESFGFEVHKVFYAQDGTSGPEVRFAWMIMCWGELDDEISIRLGPILSRSLPTAPTFSLASARRPAATSRAAQPAVARAPVRVTPQPLMYSDADDDDSPIPDLVGKTRADGPHRIKLERRVEAGGESYEVYSIPLPHVRGPMYERGRANDIVTMQSGRGRFKATVRGRGEEEYSPAKEGL